ncbi:ChaN family lipoprotein [Rhodobacter sp. Har01]|uniref:ChaN family lipoprotein n=1 Tax=Rhodobacter sp. Har01 TaxID=2883999 RepID=UPI001D097158|nr:ChaN family lipoprotein [Rhodobacter sp. Har01]MCB6179002.1 ChaN family lipoprotein [Rhodobacter sp. Har01]
MRFIAFLVALAAASAASAAPAQVIPPAGVQVYVLGEVHDNAAHHAEQARLVADLAPQAVVWEMLTPAQLLAAVGVDRADAGALAEALGWQASGWPDFAMYHPIVLAAGGAEMIGAAVPKDRLSRAVKEGAAAVVGPEAAALWALGPLPPEDQATREAEQQEAHCSALPATLLPGMVEAQRLRDQAMAAAAVAAVERGLTPVVVITGTGHARKDQGIPALIAAAAPGVTVWALGQVEADPGPDAPFDAVNLTAPAPREDPCLAFQG